MTMPNWGSAPPNQALFDEARAAHLRGDLATADRGYAAVIARSGNRPADHVDDPVFRARWNFTTIHEGRSDYANAVAILEPSRTASNGRLMPDPELHARRGQLAFKLFEQQAANNVLGVALPTLVGNRIVYEPAPLAALRAGAQA